MITSPQLNLETLPIMLELAVSCECFTAHRYSSGNRVLLQSHLNPFLLGFYVPARTAYCGCWSGIGQAILRIKGFSPLKLRAQRTKLHMEYSHYMYQPLFFFIIFFCIYYIIKSFSSEERNLTFAWAEANQLRTKLHNKGWFWTCPKWLVHFTILSIIEYLVAYFWLKAQA